MLKELLISHLVLVDHAHITFSEGFNVITGETGAGKTALIEALSLILGRRADLSKLRKGCEKATVQAIFNPLKNTEVLEQSGIDYDPNEDLIITRHITQSGKGRAFIAGQAVPLTVLQALSTQLIDPIDQHASLELKVGQKQLHYLDLFADSPLQAFQKALSQQRHLERELDELLAQSIREDVEKKAIQESLEELDEAKVQEDEEKLVYEEYQLLASAQELLGLNFQSKEQVDQLQRGIIPLQETLLKHAPFHECAALVKEAKLALTEVDTLLSQLQSKLEPNPQRLQWLEERLSLLHKLQKKYGPDLLKAKATFEEKVEKVGENQVQIDEIKVKLAAAKESTNHLASSLSEQRTKGAKKLAPLLEKELKSLNIPNAKVEFRFTPCTRTSFGDESLEIYFCANQGEAFTRLAEGTSGGELARIYFALKLLLADKQTPNTMIFDEIDANVGGETASVFGRSLQRLGKMRQVICITHFPQVAKQAHHHLKVTKKEEGDRTVSCVDLLDENTRPLELLRMAGGNQVVTSCYSDKNHHEKSENDLSSSDLDLS